MRETYWFAHSDSKDVTSTNASSDPKNSGDSKENLTQKEKEERRYLLREQQEEQRLKKIRDMESHFLQTRKHREQQEEERRRKIEEARSREIERRHQVEERKRQIWEAEQERKEAILRRNMEREARIEARRNAQRNSQSFAFGSSTPRTFDLDLAAISTGHNSVLMSSVSGRRSEERDVCPPRATSACSLDRKLGDDSMSRSMISLSSSTFRGRRRTDITPTYPRERSVTPHTGTARGKDHSRSPSRPQSSMSGTSDVSATTSSSISAVNMRPRPPPRRPRPFSIHGSLVTSSATEQKESEKHPQIHEKNTFAPIPQKRAKSASREMEKKSSKPLSTHKKPNPPPKSAEVLAKAKALPVPVKDNLRKAPKTLADEDSNKNDVQKSHIQQIIQIDSKEICAEPQKSEEVTPETSPREVCSSNFEMEICQSNFTDDSTSHSLSENDVSNSTNDNISKPLVLPQMENATVEQPENSLSNSKDILECDVTTSQTERNNLNLETTAKSRITSEEEAKMLLAEKRRLAREQAEKEAEIERQRLEKIRLQEEEQKRLEEEEQRRMEEEQIRLAELHRQMEEEKLRKAIEEQQVKEKEERERREEEARLKSEKEEQDKKSREEAERQRIELQEKLQKEEEERAERKKRVEQIMARTRGKSAAQSPSSQNDILAKMSKSVGATSSNPNPLEEEKYDDCINLQDTKHTNGIKQSASFSVSFNNSESLISSSANWTPVEGTLPDVLSSAPISNECSPESEEQMMKTSMSKSYSGISSHTLSANNILPHTNGYNSHEEMNCTTSPEENAEIDLLVDIQHKSSENNADFAKLVDLDLPLDSKVNNENFLLDISNDNSNVINTTSSFISFDGSLQKKQDAPVADLLS